MFATIVQAPGMPTTTYKNIQQHGLIYMDKMMVGLYLYRFGIANIYTASEDRGLI